MRNQSHYTETFTEPQVLFSMILEKVTDLYKNMYRVPFKTDAMFHFKNNLIQ